MPFKSEAQRRWMWKNHPAMARRWAAHTPKGKKLPRKLTNNVKSPLKSDPSRTSMLRKRFEREIIKRYTNLKRAIYQLIVVEDALGIKANPKPAASPYVFNSLLDWVKYVLNFNPSQPRDYRGRWTSGGAGSLHSALSNWVESPESVSQETKANLADEAKESRSSKAELIRISREDRGHRLGEMVDFEGPTSFTGSVEKVLAGNPIGHIGWKSSDKALYKITKPTRGLDIDYSNITSPKFSAIGENETIVSGRYRVSKIEKITEPGTNIGYGYKTTLYHLTEIEVPTVNTRWKFRTSPQKLEEFRRWLAIQIDAEIIPDEDDPIKQDEWWEKYVYEAYEKGVLRAFTDVQAKTLGESAIAYDARKEQFLRDSFVQPESAEKVKLLASRVFTDLKGVTDVMSSQMSRVLVEGLSRGDGPMKIARELNDRVDAIGITRSRVIARTEILRAHNEGQLDAFEAMGVEEVGVAVEYDTAGDGRVCKLCSAMDGVVLTIKESRGILPRHPQCRCVYLPANVGESAKGQIRSPAGIKKAFNTSIKREIPAGSKRTIAEQKALSKWGGADAKISKNRPKSIV